MPSLSSAALSLAIVSAGYLSAKCVTPPNPPPSESRTYKLDRIRYLTGLAPKMTKILTLILYTYHGVLALFCPSPSSAQDVATLQHICPHPSNLQSVFYTWNPFTIANLTLVYLGVSIRLAAYGGLGKNFTFQLATPDRLVTSGIYHFIQHPSYAGLFLVMLGMGTFVARWDASPSCLLPESLLQGTLNGLGLLTEAVLMGLGFWAMMTRLRDEEGMLKEKFGQEWVRWHSRTKRFIPFVV